MVDLYLAADTGGAGFGVASRGFILELVEDPEINLTLKTHNWNWNLRGEQMGREFTDTRFREYLLRNDLVNEDYLVEDSREAARRGKVNLTENFGSSRTVGSEECMIRQFEGKEDIWMIIGRPHFVQQAPEDEDIYTILSTDYNLDRVPKSWQQYWDQADEVWVPSEWVKKAVRNRFRYTRPDIVRKTRVFRYGVPMEYEPTKYDCHVCPGKHAEAKDRRPGKSPCLKDGKFNFLVVSRLKHLKGMYRTVKAYLEEFSGSEDVRLFLKVSTNQNFPYHPQKSVQSVVEEVDPDDTPAIGMAVEQLREQYLYDLMGHSDCFLQPSRGECFGLSPFQAAYCGTPVIATDWSAQAELMPDENPGFIMLKDYDLKKPEKESEFFLYNQFPPDSQWAVNDISELRQKMRDVFEMSEQDRRRSGRKARRYVEENFQWSEKADLRKKKIKEIAK